MESLPSRERGLKLLWVSKSKSEGIVAPLAGAWIEIVKAKVNMDNVVSLPSRERGLK